MHLRNANKVEAIQVNSVDVDDLVRRAYDVPFSASAYYDEESYSEVVQVDGVLDDREEKISENFLRGKNGDNVVVMNMLCRDGWIDPGTYIIEINP